MSRRKRREMNKEKKRREQWAWKKVYARMRLVLNGHELNSRERRQFFRERGRVMTYKGESLVVVNGSFNSELVPDKQFPYSAALKMYDVMQSRGLVNLKNGIVSHRRDCEPVRTGRVNA